MVYREETLLNVIRSVTRNGRSIIFTAVLALILVYLFSIIGFIFFKDDFLVDVDDDIVPPVIDVVERMYMKVGVSLYQHEINAILHIFRLSQNAVKHGTVPRSHWE